MTDTRLVHPTGPQRSNIHWARLYPAAERRVLHLELVTLIGITIVTGLYARPLLEEWGFIDFFNHNGLLQYGDLVRNFPLRPLQGVPLALDWLLSGGRSAGFSVGFAVLLVAKYLAARWAVTRTVPSPSAWVIAILAVVLVPWAGQWHLRYSPAQLSAMFLFLALGAVLRASRELSWRWVVLGGSAIFLMLASYQALFLCGIALPLVAFLARPSVHDGRAPALRRAAAGAAPVVLGVGLYGAYSLVVTSLLGGAGYEGALLNTSGDRLTSISGVWSVISTIYTTAYVRSSNDLILFGALLGCLIGPAAAGLRRRWAAPIYCVSLLVAIALLPLLALPYAVNPAFLTDPERVGFPISVGFVLVCLTVLSRLSGSLPGLGVLRAGAVVLALVASTTFAAAGSFEDYELQRAVLVQTGALAASAGASSVVLRDQTGVLGDVYTLYPPTLTIALRARGVDIEAVICTPTGVDRIDPVARQLQIPTTPRCEDLPPTSGPLLLLDATQGAHGIVVRPAPAS
jgi:hypothetical protein